MSLINQMLKDLDARNAPESRAHLHREVRALPVVAAPGGRRFWLPAGIVLAACAGAWLVHLYHSGSVVAVNPAPTLSTPPVPVASPAASMTQTPVEMPALASATLPAMPAATPVASAAPVMPPVTAAATIDGERVGAAGRPPAAAMPIAGTGGAAEKLAVAPLSATIASTPPVTTTPRLPPTVIDKTAPAIGPRERAETSFRNAVALVDGGRVGQAIDVLLDVLRDDGSHVSSRQLLVRLLIEQGRQDEAMALLAEGLAAQPGQIQWATSLARLQVERGDLAAAARTLQGSRAFAAANADYLGFAGHIEHRLGRQREAAEHYRSAVRLAPGDGRWWLGLGLALEADQNTAEAREAFLRARASGTLNADLTEIVEQKLR